MLLPEARTHVVRVNNTDKQVPCAFYPFPDMPLYITEDGRLFRDACAQTDTITRKLAIYEGYAGKQCPSDYIPVNIRKASGELDGIILAEDVSAVRFKTFGALEYKVDGEHLSCNIAVARKDILKTMPRHQSPALLQKTNPKLTGKYTQIKTTTCSYYLLKLLDKANMPYVLTPEYVYLPEETIKALKGEVFEFGYVDQNGNMVQFTGVDCNPYSADTGAVLIRGQLSKAVKPLAFWGIREDCERRCQLLKAEGVPNSEINRVQGIRSTWEQYLESLKLLGITPFSFFLSNFGVLPKTYVITRPLHSILSGYTGRVRVYRESIYKIKTEPPDWDNIISIDTHGDDLTITPDGTLGEGYAHHDITVRRDYIVPQQVASDWGLCRFIPGVEETTLVKIPWRTEYPIGIKNNAGRKICVFMQGMRNPPDAMTQYYAKPEDVESLLALHRKFSALTYAPQFLGINMRYWDMEDIDHLEIMLAGRAEGEYIAAADLSENITMALLPKLYGMLFCNPQNLTTFLNLLLRRGYLQNYKVRDTEFFKTSDLTEELLLNHISEYEELYPNNYQIVVNLVLNADMNALQKLQCAVRSHEITKV